MPNDSDLIRMLREGKQHRQAAWEYMYKTWRSAIRRKVLQKGGTPKEAVQALGVICKSWEKTVCRADFKLHSAGLKHYLSMSVYYAWLKIKKLEPPKMDELDEGDISLQVIEHPLANLEIRSFLQDVLTETVGERCRKVLCWYSAGYSMEEIGQMLHLQTDSTKNLKSRCLKKLTDYFENNPEKLSTIKKLIYE